MRNLSLVLPRNEVFQHHIIQFLLFFPSSGPLQEIKYKRNFQTFSSKNGHSRLQEVVTYKRFQI